MATALTNYLERATSALRQIGCDVAGDPVAPVLPLIAELASLDEQRATAIARTLQQESAFNQAVRIEVGGMDTSNRYASITAGFDSIREDAARMAAWLTDGRIDWKERLQQTWMELSRGSIADRFQSIRSTYLEVTQATEQQLRREGIVLNAYNDFRFALKQAEVDARELLQTTQARRTAAQEAHHVAQQAVTDANRADIAELARLELARDEAARGYRREDRRYQVAKDLAENLSIAYNTAEAVFARLDQITTVKARVYSQAVTFFSTNDVVFTALCAATTANQGLSESTKTLEAMKAGINKGIESIATGAGAQMQEALAAGYGPTISAKSVRTLVESIISFQESSKSLIESLRQQATANADELAAVVESGKQRYAALANGAARPA